MPASIQVIPQQVLEDQGVTTLRDAVQKNASGVVVQYDNGGAGAFNIRGFTQNFNFRNGFPDRGKTSCGKDE
ncbi:MAG: Plug domain-containing protein [Nostoc sp.]|uniref:Plug domain-containing protein n=1 Tax=Nostoc sp. TaxID=1180 RepID=UPI002FF6DE3C